MLSFDVTVLLIASFFTDEETRPREVKLPQGHTTGKRRDSVWATATSSRLLPGVALLDGTPSKGALHFSFIFSSTVSECSAPIAVSG